VSLAKTLSGKKDWLPEEKQFMRLVKGKVLDIG